jgi:hypothetical protein
MNRAIPIVAAGLVLLAATACSAQLGDRGGVEGSPPDYVGDVTWIEVYRSADNFPNVALVCVKGIGFATTSSGRGESAGATPLVRVAEWDTACAAKAGA